jgi:hypothetical protein
MQQQQQLQQLQQKSVACSGSSMLLLSASLHFCRASEAASQLDSEDTGHAAQLADSSHAEALPPQHSVIAS